MQAAAAEAMRAVAAVDSGGGGGGDPQPGALRGRRRSFNRRRSLTAAYGRPLGCRQRAQRLRAAQRPSLPRELALRKLEGGDASRVIVVAASVPLGRQRGRQAGEQRQTPAPEPGGCSEGRHGAARSEKPTRRRRRGPQLLGSAAGRADARPRAGACAPPPHNSARHAGLSCIMAQHAGGMQVRHAAAADRHPSASCCPRQPQRYAPIRSAGREEAPTAGVPGFTVAAPASLQQAPGRLLGQRRCMEAVQPWPAPQSPSAHDMPRWRRRRRLQAPGRSLTPRLSCMDCSGMCRVQAGPGLGPHSLCPGRGPAAARGASAAACALARPPAGASAARLAHALRDAASRDGARMALRPPGGRRWRGWRLSRAKTLAPPLRLPVAERDMHGCCDAQNVCSWALAACVQPPARRAGRGALAGRALPAAVRALHLACHTP